MEEVSWGPCCGFIFLSREFILEYRGGERLYFQGKATVQLKRT